MDESRNKTLIINLAWLLVISMVFSSGCDKNKNVIRTRDSGTFPNWPNLEAHASSPLSLYNQSWAVIIGIDKYKNLKPKRLNYAVTDAKKMTEVLERLGFPHKNISLLTDEKATKQAIEEHLNEKLARIGPNDRLLVFFAGHGIEKTLPSGKKEGFLTPHDVDVDNLYGTGISMEDIERLGNRNPAKHTLFILDTCYSALAIKRQASDSEEISLKQLYKIAGKRAVQLLTAGRSDETVEEKDGHGVFTARLIEGLNGAADTDGNGVLAVPELYNFVYSRVFQDTKGQQNPVFHSYSGEGHFLFKWPPPSLVDRAPRMVGMQRGIPDHLRQSYLPASLEAELKQAIVIDAHTLPQMRERASEGDSFAQAVVGAAYFVGKGVERNEGNGLRWIRAAADQGDTFAQSVLGIAYFYGYGVLRDEVTGRFWLFRAAELMFKGLWGLPDYFSDSSFLHTRTCRDQGPDR